MKEILKIKQENVTQFLTSNIYKSSQSRYSQETGESRIGIFGLVQNNQQIKFDSSKLEGVKEILLEDFTNKPFYVDEISFTPIFHFKVKKFDDITCTLELVKITENRIDNFNK